MSDRDAFLRAVYERPGDDTPRLVYADWLDEHGEPDRAAFIRSQCELERLGTGDPEVVRLLAAHHDLLHRTGWDTPDTPGLDWEELPGPLRYGLLPDYYRRGFRWRTRAKSPLDFLTASEELFAAAPVGAVMFDQADPEEVNVLADHPRLVHVEAVRLGVDRSPFRETFDACRRALARFARSPHAGHITELELQFGVWADVAPEALTESPLLLGLHRLAIGLGTASYRTLDLMRWLAARVELTRLTRLEAGIRDLPLDVVRGLAAGPIRQVRELELGGYSALSGVAALRALVESGPFPRLTWLDLSHWNLQDEGTQILAESGAFPHLRVLILRGNGISPVGLQRLFEAPFTRHLTLLHLGRNPITDAGPLLSAELPELELLDLSQTEIPRPGREALRRRWGERLFPRKE